MSLVHKTPLSICVGVMEGGEWGSKGDCLSDEREEKEGRRREGEKGRQTWKPVCFEGETSGKQEPVQAEGWRREALMEQRETGTG